MAGNVLFEIKDVAIDRGTVRVLEIEGLTLRQGLTYAIMGPNGAGKTTLLHMLNRLTPPTRGTIKFGGIDLYTDGAAGKELQRKMTLVMQPPLLFDTSVFDNVAYGLRARKMGRNQITGKVRHYLDRVDLKGFEKREARKLSGGEAQRVAIARALALEPEVLLLDEPTTFIDRSQANIVEHLITDIGAEHTMTILFATHNIRQAYRLADEVINIHEGRIVSSDMVNLFRGTLRDVQGDRCFDTGCVEINLPREIDMVSYISVDPREIEFSRDQPSGNSPNTFKGCVIRIEDLDRIVQVTVDIGERLVVQIPKNDYLKEQAELDASIWVTFTERALKTF